MATKRDHIAKFARLKNGSWGVRVTGPHAEVFAGRTVPVTKRSGEEVSMTLSKMLWTGTGKFGKSAIYSVTRKGNQNGASPEAPVHMDRDAAEIAAGAAAVAQIQAISAPGSALREQLYMEMEQRDYDLGLVG